MRRYSLSYDLKDESYERYDYQAGCMVVVPSHVDYALITRDGKVVWQIPGDSPEDAARLGVAWLDKHKPDWRKEGAYAGEL